MTQSSEEDALDMWSFCIQSKYVHILLDIYCDFCTEYQNTAESGRVRKAKKVWQIAKVWKTKRIQKTTRVWTADIKSPESQVSLDSGAKKENMED